MWQFDDDDEAPTHPDRVAHRANIEEVTVVMTGGDFDAALDELDEPPPAAVRPLGRLGGGYPLRPRGSKKKRPKRKRGF